MIVKRRLSDVDPLGPVAASLAIATLLVTPFALADVPTETPSGDVIASIVVLGLICSALAFLFFFRLIAEVGPSRATVITYVNPVVALALGVAILDESVTAGAVAGLLLILAGSWLSTDGRLPPGLAGLAGARARHAVGRYTGGTAFSTSPFTLSKIVRARSRCSRSCVAMTLVRSSAPPRCTAGWIATFT